MYTVRSCFATIVAFLVVAIGWWAVDAVVCCNSSSVASANGDVVASCQNKNRTFHIVELLGGRTCNDNQTAVPIRKCCPFDQWYDKILEVCQPAGMDGDEHLRCMMDMILKQRYFDKPWYEAFMVGYNYYEQPLCDAGDKLFDVPSKVARRLIHESSASELPPGYCFDLTPYEELVTLTCQAAAVVCCNSSSVASAGGDVVASCQNKNRMFHMVEVIDGGTCDDNQTAVPIRKCCPLGQWYDKMLGFCRPAGVDGDEHLRRMMMLLKDKSHVLFDAVMVGYNYDGLRCDDPNEIVDYSFFKRIISPLEDHCFDLTLDGELVVLACRRRKHCLENTCVRRCCKGDRMIVDGSNGPECTVNEKPFRMFAYRTNGNGTPVYHLESSHLPSEALSKNKVMPYYVEFKCSHRDMLEYGFQLTENGSLYLTYENHLVPHAEYCVGYSQGIVTDTIVAYICDADTVFMDKRAARASSIHLFYRASYVASAVCLAFTLLVYNTLPSLRNNRNYYVKCYMSHELASYICVIAQMIMENKRGHTCVLFGYITLFVFLSTLCWLNVICFDIYWMIRYNISINRNTSTSIRTTMYHFYCLGLPSIIVCTGLVFKYSQEESLQRFAPNFGEYGCVYYHMSDIGGVIFILLPVFVILTINLILFRVTTKHSSIVKSEINKFNRTDSKTENFLLHREKFVMSTKLFLIMGVPYFLTVLTIILRIEGAIRYISYAASSLQGVFICIIFVVKPQVIMELMKMFRSSMDHSEPTQFNLVSGSS